MHTHIHRHVYTERIFNDDWSCLIIQGDSNDLSPPVLHVWMCTDRCIHRYTYTTCYSYLLSTSFCCQIYLRLSPQERIQTQYDKLSWWTNPLVTCRFTYTYTDTLLSTVYPLWDHALQLCYIYIYTSLCMWQYTLTHTGLQSRSKAQDLHLLTATYTHIYTSAHAYICIHSTYPSTCS